MLRNRTLNRLTEVARLRVKHYTGKRLTQKELDKCVKASRTHRIWYDQTRDELMTLAGEINKK